MTLDLHLKGFYRKAGGDKRLRRPHLCLYMALLASSPGAAFLVNRRAVMALARIDSRVTYHCCMRELDQWGYINYQPSYDPGSKSQVYIKPLAVRKLQLNLCLYLYGLGKEGSLKLDLN